MLADDRRRGDVIAGMGDTMRDERGAVLVIVATVLFALLGLAVLVIETANWFEHRRHLQLQADAAALAGGAAFQLPGCSDTTIYTAVRQYAGVKDVTYASPYNQQVGGTPSANAHVLVNSTKYWRDGGTDYSDGGTPCAASMVDVKMTETDLPWFLENFLVPTINAHARVAMKLVDSLGGQLPIGVPDVNPQSGAVIFYDEANPGNAATTYAKYVRKLGSANGLNEWSNTDPSGIYTPASVIMPPSGRLGVVLAFSSDGPPTSSPMRITDLSGNPMSATAICTQARVDCYANPASSGLLFVNGGRNTAPDKTPVLENATLETSNCPDSYAYFTYNTASCTAILKVYFISNVSNLANVRLTAIPGAPCSAGGGGDMNGGGNLRNIDITIPANAGPCPITVNWAVRSETNFPSAPSPPGVTCPNNFPKSGTCFGTFGVTQVAFGGNDDLSGPVRIAHLINMDSSYTTGLGTCPGPLGYGAACNTTQISGSPRSLAVDVELAGALTTSVSDPPVLLRIVGSSQNGSLDCNPTGNLREQIAIGCKPRYAINTDPNFACGNPPWKTKADIFASTPPFPCVAIQTGGTVGQFTQGIQQRILGGSNSCPASGPGRNYWSRYPDFPTSDTDGFNDPRIVYVFMVPFGSFRGSGNDILPVVSFGIFYIRGWGGNGMGNDDPCPGAIPNVPTGDLAGNFITRVVTSGAGSGTQACVIGSFNPCVAVLTK